MIKIAVSGHNEKDKKNIEKNLVNAGYKTVQEKPELVIIHGGDGSFLYAEHKYPQVPKILNRNKSICNICNENIELQDIMNLYISKKYVIKKTPYIKVHIKHKNGKSKTIFAVSDVTIRNVEQFHAIRFGINTTKKLINNVIADGIVVANKIGLKGYFFSITKKKLSDKINMNKYLAVAINNDTTPKRKYYISEKTKFVLKRNNATLTVDNVPKIIKIEPGDFVEFSIDKKSSQIISLKQERM